MQRLQLQRVGLCALGSAEYAQVSEKEIRDVNAAVRARWHAQVEWAPAHVLSALFFFLQRDIAKARQEYEEGNLEGALKTLDRCRARWPDLDDKPEYEALRSEVEVSGFSVMAVS